MPDEVEYRRRFMQYSRRYGEKYYEDDPGRLPGETDSVYFGLYALLDDAAESPLPKDGAVYFAIFGPHFAEFHVGVHGWRALLEDTVLLAALSKVESEDFTANEFCQLLVECGYEDVTDS